MPTEAEYLPEIVSAELRKTFEGIAKLALQGAAEADDPAVNIIDKARKAHARVTLIIEDAMRGLAQVNESMFVGGIIAGVEAGSDEDS
ncbi:MAG TPA: hypothetical protein VN442_18805 [Bryobacteraceae bacterium]|nr:hypothetical protein [Bryobacteraceae bacterium]